MREVAAGRFVFVLVVSAFVGCGGCDSGSSEGRGSSADSGGGISGASDSGSVSSPGGGDGGSEWQGTDGGPIQGGEEILVPRPDGSMVPCVVTTCAGKLLECGNCEDDDGDGSYDSWDRECLGPCDNTEGPALTAGVGGEGGGPCKADCYFDFGNGSGNDECYWDHRCDPLSVAPNFHPEGPDCEYDEEVVGSKDCPSQQSDTCLEVCRPLTPNGCDCFGCCTFPELDGGYVWIGSMDDDKNGTCTFDALHDPAACEPCTPVADCANDCQRCELCIGKETVPEDCFVPSGGGGGGGGDDAGGGGGGMDAGSGGGGGTTNPGQCPDGEQACGLPGQPSCPSNHYCVSGCCQLVIN